MVTTPLIAQRARPESDQAPELTLDGLIARMRHAAQRSISSEHARRTTNSVAEDKAADVAALLQAQLEFNQALVSVVHSIAQYLKQTRIAEKPAVTDAPLTIERLGRIDILTSQINELAQKLEQANARLNEADQNNHTLIDALADRLNAIQQDVAANRQHLASQIEPLQRHIASSHAASLPTEARLAEIELRMLRAERDLRKKAKSEAKPASIQLDAMSIQTFIRSDSTQPVDHASGAVAPQPAATAPDLSFDYFVFEQRFRGPTDEIKQRQQAYLDYFLPADSVLDLGCGRGEFVELLAERGIAAIGVDLSEDMVDFCRARGLPVLLGDLFEYLAAQSDASLGGIFVSQVVEHLPPDQVWKLIQLAAARLKTNGILLLETINPQCFAAMSCFYLDPSHVRPYHAALLAFMCVQAGFHLECIQFSAPLPTATTGAVLKSPDIVPPTDAMHYQDYAVIARRTQLPLETE